VAKETAGRWAVNASPLITLGQIGQLSLLNKLAQKVVVVPAVVAEVLRGEDAASAALASALASSQFHQVEAVEPDATIALWGLGPGETNCFLLSISIKNKSAKRF
jgi:predicted nucleic acid-binding protein